jgi:hypothetical protein
MELLSDNFESANHVSAPSGEERKLCFTNAERSVALLLLLKELELKPSCTMCMASPTRAGSFLPSGLFPPSGEEERGPLTSLSSIPHHMVAALTYFPLGQGFGSYQPKPSHRGKMVC